MCMVGCGETKPEDNVAFDSIEEMQACLNGKWFAISSNSLMNPSYTEIIFNGDEIKKCEVYGWIWKKVEDENGKQELEYELKNYDNLKFEEYESGKPTFKYKIGEVKFNYEAKNINIKEYVEVGDGKEVREKYLLIGNTVYFKATDKTELSYDNFETFFNFCEKTLPKKSDCFFASTYYREKNASLNIEEGLEEKYLFTYYGWEKTSFEIYQDYFKQTHFFAQTDEFKTLYEEIEKIHGFCHRTNIIALIGTEMPDFDKKDWVKNHSFRELKYYLCMSSKGKLISNIS